MDQITRDARKLLFSGTTVICLIGLAGGLWFICVEFLPTVDGIVSGVPMLRIYPASIVMLPFFLFGSVGYAAIALRAIPVRDSIIKVFRRLVIWLFWLMLASFLFGVLIASVGQHQYFPKNGYTECDQLQGAPSVWFTDWVKNPAWCVKGKDRAWVFEQARIEIEGKAPSTGTTQ
jgi:hypothetical protein